MNLAVKFLVGIQAARDGVGAVVEQVVVQSAVTSSKLLLFKEHAVVHESQRVENVKLLLLGKNQGIAHELVESLLEVVLVDWLDETSLGTIVEEVSNTDDLVLGVVDN